MKVTEHANLVSNLYSTFEHYLPGRVFGCTHCYSEQELDCYANTPPEELPIDMARTMLWETGDHWESADSFRCFLPRLLEIIGPPEFREDIYPAHTFETLMYHAFGNWPQKEKDSVLIYLTSLTPRIKFHDEEDKQEWLNGLSRIRAA